MTIQRVVLALIKLNLLDKPQENTRRSERRTRTGRTTRSKQKDKEKETRGQKQEKENHKQDARSQTRRGRMRIDLTTKRSLLDRSKHSSSLPHSKAALDVGRERLSSAQSLAQTTFYVVSATGHILTRNTAQTQTSGTLTHLLARGTRLDAP